MKEQFISIALVTTCWMKLDDVTRETRSEGGVASHDLVITGGEGDVVNDKFKLAKYFVICTYL